MEGVSGGGEGHSHRPGCSTLFLGDGEIQRKRHQSVPFSRPLQKPVVHLTSP